MFMPLQWFNAWKSVSLSRTHTEFTPSPQSSHLVFFFLLSVTSNLASPVDRPRFGERPALRLYLLMRTIFATRHPGPTLFPSGLFVYSFCARVCVYVCMCAPVHVSVGCVVCLHRCVCLSFIQSISFFACISMYFSFYTFCFFFGLVFFPLPCVIVPSRIPPSCHLSCSLVPKTRAKSWLEKLSHMQKYNISCFYFWYFVFKTKLKRHYIHLKGVRHQLNRELQS